MLDAMRPLLIVGLAACGGESGALPDAPAVADAAADAPVDLCVPPSGAGTDQANALATDTTWTAAGSPHRIASQVTIPIGVTLTLEPCAIVELAGGAKLTVNGTLRAAGEAARQIRIRASTGGPLWQSIDVSGRIDLERVIVSGGGAPGAGDPALSAMLRVRGDRSAAGTAIVRVRDVSLLGSGSVGMMMRDAARFSNDSSGLTITTSAQHPLTVEPIALTELPAGNYAGNTTDLIDVARVAVGASGQSVAITMRDRGIAYRMGAAGDPNPAQVIGVGTGGTASWTIEAGATLKFRAGYRLDVNATSGGVLAVNGTSTAPILMTSAAATPAAGDWVGLAFGGIPLPATRIDNAIIEFAGDPGTSAIGFSCGTPPAGGNSSRTMGAVLIASSVSGVAPTAFITNTIIRDSASNGVDRGYRADAVIDFATTNTFSRIAYCSQTSPRTAANSCPDPVPCPAAP